MSPVDPTPLAWSSRFPLHLALFSGERNSIPKGVGGIYMWGFDVDGVEVIWYIGKSTAKKSLRQRLRDHCLELMSCKYQIPKYFLNDKSSSLEDIASGWTCDRSDAVAEQLLDFEYMSKVNRAGHMFATHAFARIAILSDISNERLTAIENATIFDLQPFINIRGKLKRSVMAVRHKESPQDAWLQNWRSIEKTLPKTKNVVS